MTTDERRRLEAAIAGWVTEVPGVAYLSPRLTRRLTSRPGAADGVRLRHTEPVTVEVRVAVRPGHQAAATARAVRDRISGERGAQPALAGSRIEVIVTACLDPAGRADA
ncbi:hypothetical protein ACIRBX_36420 [Kitasatospora sp. NPDC096147]|uniref:hypothetical protein n=1 Tax=Kitasatospora sp. NPDC096147 TaxID=3364093 RepID=UPI00380024FC